MIRTAIVLVVTALATACTHDAPTHPLPLSDAALTASAALRAPADAPGEATSTAFRAAGAAMAITQLVTGGRASGHADFVFSGIRSKYTFTSITTTFPAAKGRFELHRWFPDGRMLVMTGDVECMTIIPTPEGGEARMSGRVDRLRVDNQNVVVPPDLDRTIWTVLDNGEGKDATPDIASGLFNFRTAAEAELHCATGIIQFGFFITRGNLQVRPD